MTTATAGSNRAVPGGREAQFRYGAVFLIVLTLLLFEALTPDSDWGRAIGVALTAAGLTVAIATSRVRGQVRRARALAVGGSAFVIVIGIGTGVIPAAPAFLIGTALLAAIPVDLAGGLFRLIRDHGVTPQAIAGALTVYLVVGLLFTAAMGFVSHVESGPYFAQGSHVPNGVRVYYSFTVMTTTGFGDYTAAQSVGRALAVLEMLVGQLYLVTVIGVLVGNLVGRRGARHT